MNKIWSRLFFLLILLVFNKTVYGQSIEAVFGKDNIVNSGSQVWINVRNLVDLHNKSLVLPSSCCLNFVGGTLTNGTLSGEKIRIIAPSYHIFQNIVLKGSMDVDAVSVEWFGAKGDGKTDDTSAFAKALATGQNIVLGRKEYLVSQTLDLDVSRQSISGQDGLSVLVCSSVFQGDCCLRLTNTNVNYYGRYRRMRRFSDFSIRGNKKINGIQVGSINKVINDNHVDELLFENIYVELTKTALLLGNHLYKCTFFHCTFREQEYAVRSCEGQFDSGEAILFEGCAFFDSKTKVDVSCSMNFVSCTSHGNWIVSKDAQVVCQNCHFERTKGNTVADDPIFVTKGTSSLLLNSCDAVISNGIWTCTNCVFRADDLSRIVVQGGTWEYFLKRVTTTDKKVLAKGDVTICNNKMPFRWQSGFLVEAVYDYSSSNSFYSTENIDSFFCNIKDVKTEKQVGGSVLISLHPDVLEIKEKKIKFGKIFRIPDQARTVWAREKIRFDRNSFKGSFMPVFNTGSSQYEGFAFLDDNYNVILDTGNKAVFLDNTITANIASVISFDYPLSIPLGARYVIMGGVFYLNLPFEGEIQFSIEKYMLEFL